MTHSLMVTPADGCRCAQRRSFVPSFLRSSVRSSVRLFVRLFVPSFVGFVRLLPLVNNDDNDDDDDDDDDDAESQHSATHAADTRQRKGTETDEGTRVLTRVSYRGGGVIQQGRKRQ